MNTVELLNILKNDPYTSKMNCEVLPLDHFLIKSIRSPSAVIFNYDNSDEPGSHWVATFTLADGQVEYFDPFGVKPLTKTLMNKIISLSVQFPVFNSTAFQGESFVCGQYCLIFLLLRARGFHTSHIKKLMMLCDSTHERDHVICDFINMTFSKFLSSPMNVHSMSYD